MGRFDGYIFKALTTFVIINGILASFSENINMFPKAFFGT
jgi:hypothetical protein